MKKILAIDDQNDNLIVYRRILSDLRPDFVVFTALSGNEGITKAEIEKPDVILLDIIMPEMDGFQVCQHLKTLDSCRHIPIILITANTKDSASKAKGLNCGADAFLSKPIDEIELIAQINAMIRIKESEDNLRRQRDTLKETVDETTRKLNINQEHLNLFLDDTNEGICRWDVNNGKVSFNENFVRILTHESDKNEFDYSWWQSRMHPDSVSLFKHSFEQYKSVRAKYFEIEYQILDRNERWKWIWFRATAIEYDEYGHPLIILGSQRDISERKQAEEQIKNALLEKETLLHEIHHRVKNNMQVIASLLKLQLNRRKKQDVNDILNENIGRVYAMAEIHENLHRSEKLSEIGFKPYLQKLTQMLSQTYSVDQSKVAFQIDTPDLKLGIDKANPVGLALNELISNSLKYAFPNDQKGTISIKSRVLESDVIELIIADDGVGIPEGIDWESIDTLGLSIVHNLVRNQLNGSIDLETTNGTKFIIKFNIESNYKS